MSGWCPDASEWFRQGLLLCESQWVVLAPADDLAGCSTSVEFPGGPVDTVSLNYAALAVDCEPAPPGSQQEEDCWAMDRGERLVVTVD